MKRDRPGKTCRGVFAAALTVLLFGAVFVRQVRAETPPFLSWQKQIEAGDFSLLKEETQETIDLLSASYRSLQPHSRYVLQDINQDGQEELLWLYERGEEEPAYLVAVFANGYHTVRMALCAPENEELKEIRPASLEEQCYIVNGERILYLNHNTWTVSEVHCTEVLFDRNYDIFAGEGLSMYLVADEEAYRTEVDAAIRRRLSFVDGRGVWYFRVPTGKETDEGIPIGADAFLSAFRDFSGTSFAQTMLSYETMRTGIERGVARHVYRRQAETAGSDNSVSVAYPQIDADASTFSPAINTILMQEAFAMTKLVPESSGEETANANELALVLQETRAERKEEVQYRILHDDDTLISVLFLSRPGNAAEEMKLLTVSKLNGRQIQIGDLTTTEALSGAVQRGAAEVFVLDEELRRQLDDEKTQEEVAAAFQETVAASEQWKSIGLDEQYLYLTLQEGDGLLSLLRIPRWESGFDSPGHMHLLSMHRAYPFLKEVLDDAECLKVRRRAGGFDIDYRTSDGGSVSARLGNSEEEEKTFDSPEAARDYYMAQFADVTGFTTGSFLRQDPAADRAGEERRGRFYATETAFGEGGHALLTAGERVYELTQRCRSTRGGFFLREDDAQTDVEGTLRMEADGNGLWNNTKDEARTLIRRLSEEKTVRIEFTKAAPRRIRMQIVPEAGGAAFAETEFELTELPPYRFADFNADGTDDLEVTAGEASCLFLYEDATGGFTAVPSLYEAYEARKEESGDVTFRYDAGTGYLLLLYSTPEDGDYKRELYVPEQPEQACRELRFDASESDGEYRYEIFDLTGEQRETLLRLDYRPDAPEAYDCMRFSEELFRSRYVYDARVAHPEAAAEGEAQREVRVILGQIYRPDLFAPCYEYRLYLLEEGGTLLYTYDVPVTDLLTEVYRGFAEGKEALVLRFETGETYTLPLDGWYEQD